MHPLKMHRIRIRTVAKENTYLELFAINIQFDARKRKRIDLRLLGSTYAVVSSDDI